MKPIISLLMLLTLICTCVPAFALERSEWLSPDQYYYSQLSPEHKAAWENDIQNALSYPEQKNVPSNVRNQALAPMIKADNPRIFWIDWIDSTSMLRYETGSVAHYQGLEFADGKTLAEHQALFLQGIDTAVAEIQAKLPKKAGTEDKVRAIYAWICDNNTYNDYQTSKYKKNSDPVAFAYLAAHSAYSAIIKNDEYQPVCEGYAGAFKVLCDAFNVPCLCVSGSMTSLSAHMWNYVQLENGAWYQVDATTGDAYSTTLFCMMNSSYAAKYEYAPNPYMGSGVNPTNGYTEGAAFTVPTLAK